VERARESHGKQQFSCSLLASPSCTYFGSLDARCCILMQGPTAGYPLGPTPPSSAPTSGVAYKGAGLTAAPQATDLRGQEAT
jgi:hypothetical protein